MVGSRYCVHSIKVSAGLSNKCHSILYHLNDFFVSVSYLEPSRHFGSGFGLSIRESHHIPKNVSWEVNIWVSVGTIYSPGSVNHSQPITTNIDCLYLLSGQTHYTGS